MRPLPLASALLAVFLLGCQSEAPDVPEPVRTSVSEPAKTDPAPEPVAQEKGHNSDRIYQLSKLEKGTIKVDGKPVPVWLMNDGGKRQEGMMFLTPKEVKPEEGMLFVFPDEQGPEHGFWMSNTILPLDIIYVSKDFKVVHMVKGKPFDETSLPATAAFQYVIELREGQAAKLKIKKGSSVEIPVPLRKTY